jgi:hypothetical protein
VTLFSIISMMSISGSQWAISYARRLLPISSDAKQNLGSDSYTRFTSPVVTRSVITVSLPGGDASSNNTFFHLLADCCSEPTASSDAGKRSRKATSTTSTRRSRQTIFGEWILPYFDT